MSIENAGIKDTLNVIKEYSEKILGVVRESFQVVGNPTQFFANEAADAKNVNRIVTFTIVLAIFLHAVAAPIMISVGVDAFEPKFIISNVVLTIFLFCFYALCFHAPMMMLRKDVLQTYKVVVYSSVWLLFAYLPLHQLQRARFMAMSASSDSLNLGYYAQFRETLDASWYLTAMNFLGAGFYIVFGCWVYVGIRTIHKMSKTGAVAVTFAGLLLMVSAAHYVQTPIDHQLILTFKKS